MRTSGDIGRWYYIHTSEMSHVTIMLLLGVSGRILLSPTGLHFHIEAEFDF